MFVCWQERLYNPSQRSNPSLQKGLVRVILLTEVHVCLNLSVWSVRGLSWSSHSACIYLPDDQRVSGSHPNMIRTWWKWYSLGWCHFILTRMLYPHEPKWQTENTEPNEHHKIYCEYVRCPSVFDYLLFLGPLVVFFRLSRMPLCGVRCGVKLWISYVSGRIIRVHPYYLVYAYSSRGNKRIKHHWQRFRLVGPTCHACIFFLKYMYYTTHQSFAL